MKKLKKILKKYKKGEIKIDRAIAELALWFWTNMPVEEVDFQPESDWLQHADNVDWVEYNPYTDPIPDTWENVKVRIKAPFKFGDKEENKA